MAWRAEATVHLPASKSEALRACIVASLSPGETSVCGLSPSGDLGAFLSNAPALFEVRDLGQGEYIFRGGPWKTVPVVQCGDSAFLLRSLPFILAAQRIGAVLRGSRQLFGREHRALLSTLDRCQIPYRFDRFDRMLEVWPVEAFPEQIPLGAIDSSQPLSGLLMALPLLGGGSRLTYDSVASMGYVELSLRVMRAFGVEVEHRVSRREMLFRGGGYGPGRYVVEGDWSAAAFFLPLVALGQNLRLSPLRPSSLQPDRSVLDLAQELGLRIGWEGEELILQRGDGELHGFTLDLFGTPDLFPPLVALALAVGGECRLGGCGRLRSKESDRLLRIEALLDLLRVPWRQQGDWLTIGTYARSRELAPELVYDPLGDHRMAMCAAVSAYVCGVEVQILGPECVQKSYPAFFEDFERLARPEVSALGTSQGLRA